MDHEPTNNGITFGLLTVILIISGLSGMIHHDEFQWWDPAFLILKSRQCTINRNYSYNEAKRFLFHQSNTNKPNQTLQLIYPRRVKLVVQEDERGGTTEIFNSPLLSAIRVISLTFLWRIATIIKMLGDYIVIG